MCATGGTLKTVINRTSGAAGSAANPSGKGRVKVKNYNDPERAFGRESRSLKACYEVLQVRWPSIRTSAVPSPRGQMCLVRKCCWCPTELEGESLCGFVCE